MRDIEYKGYIISSTAFNDWIIKPKGRGSVKKALKGTFTRIAFAEQSIDSVLKEQKNGAQTSTSGA